MSRSLGVSVENSFVKGFLTENSGLNFPESACKDILNCVLSEYGEVKRRPSLDLESGYTLTTNAVSDTDAVIGYLWTGVGILGDISYVVYQIGSKIHFWESSSSGSVSGSKKAFMVDLESLKVSGAPPTATKPCSFASGNGKLFVAHSYCQPFYIEYNQSTDSITTVTITIEIRDFVVQDDGLTTDFNPASLSDLHRYNLYNQGWTDASISSWVSSNYNYPSKAQIPWFYRNATSASLDFSPANRYKYEMVGATLAPRGFKVLNAFYQDRGISSIPIISAGYQRPTSVVFMNSRIFLSGIQSSGFGSTIYFSSIMKATSQDFQFYQRNDPTSEISNELLSNDGGYIVIPDADAIVAISQVKSYLLVFCTNGVWAIGGSQGIGFSATDYMVQKVSDTPIISPQSLIIVENTPVWWNHDGIYTTSVALENLQVSSLTKGTIQEFFNSIPNVCKQYVRPAYNRLTSEVTWLYSSDSANPSVYDSALVFRVTTKAFYKHSFTSNSYKVKGLLTVFNHTSPTQVYPIYTVSGSRVTVTDGSQVVINSSSSTDFSAVYYLMLVSDGNNISFAVYKDDIYIDWVSLGNTTSYDSYLMTAYRTRGDAIRKFQVQSIIVYSRQVSNSSCFMKGLWDYAADEGSNSITVEQQAINGNTHRVVNSRSLRVRGSGITLQLFFRSDGSKPFHLIGWVAQEVVNDRV